MEAFLHDDALCPVRNSDVRPEREPRPGGVFMEHRFGRRFRCGTHVRVASSGEFAGEGRMLNVSLSGAYLETALDLPLFALVDVTADRNGRHIELRGCVVRKDARGAGVEWTETPGRSICEIFGCTQRCEVP